MKFEWEYLNYSADEDGKRSWTERAKVHGGWIVKNVTIIDYELSESTLLVPDQKHEWTIDE
jgi:hypothetical protein